MSYATPSKKLYLVILTDFWTNQGNHLAYPKDHKEKSHHPELKKNTHPEVGKKVRKTHSHAGDPSDLKEKRKTKHQKKAELHEAEAEEAERKADASKTEKQLHDLAAGKTRARATKTKKQSVASDAVAKEPERKSDKRSISAENQSEVTKEKLRKVKEAQLAALSTDSSATRVRKTKPKKPLAKHRLVPVADHGKGQEEGAGEKRDTIEDKKPSSVNEFSTYKLDKELLVGLDCLGISKPTPIQEKAIPSLLRGEDVILSAETGSGKTLTFLLPLIQQLLHAQKNGVKLREKYPRALILVPNKDLARQISVVISTITRRAGLKLVTATVTPADKAKKQARALEKAPDIVVATPGRLMQHRLEERVFFSDVRHVIVDECDTLFGNAFVDSLKTILTPIRSMVEQGKKVQFVFVSATVPEQLENDLKKQYKGLTRIQTDSLGKPLSNLSHEFVHTSEEKRLDKLLELLEQDRIYEYEKVLIFCSSVSRCNRVNDVLAKHKHRAAVFHGGILPQLRAKNYESFVRGETQILISTDIASRGLDTINVGHVILFDFPLDGTEYLRKTGRAGRAGLQGRATSFVTKKDHPFSQQLEEALNAGQNISKLRAAAAQPQKLRKVYESRSDSKLMEKDGKHNKNFNPFRKRVSKDQRSSKKQIKSALQRKGPTIKSKKFEHLWTSMEQKQKREEKAASKPVKK